VSGVVGVAGEYSAGAVKLFGEDETGEGVGIGEGAEGKQDFGAGKSGGGPTAGGADGEDDVLDPVLPVRAKPGGEEFGGHRATAIIEQGGDGGGSGMLAVEPGEEGIFGLEGLGLAAEDGAPLKVLGREGLEGVAAGKTGADVRNGDVHGRKMGYTSTDEVSCLLSVKKRKYLQRPLSHCGSGGIEVE